MNKVSIFDLVFAPIPLLKDRPFRLQPRRATGRSMRTEQFAEGVIHYSSYRAAYLEPPPKIGHRVDIDAHGRRVPVMFPVLQPWRRVTEKVKRTGRARRAWLAEQRVNA